MGGGGGREYLAQFSELEVTEIPEDMRQRLTAVVVISQCFLSKKKFALGITLSRFARLESAILITPYRESAIL
jgi:hypothetical protein